MKKNNIFYEICIILIFMLFGGIFGKMMLQVRRESYKTQNIEIHEPAPAWNINNKYENDRFIYYQLENKEQNFHFLVVKEKNNRSIVIINLEVNDDG